MVTEMNSLDEWQLLKTLAIELSVLTESVCCECSICEFRLLQSSGQQMPMQSYMIEKQQLLPSQIPNQLLSQISSHSPIYSQFPSSQQHLMRSSAESSLPRESVNTADISCNTKNTQNASYERLFETVSAIFDRSSTESSILLTQNAWCQDVSLYNVWNNIQQSRTASIQLLVRSLSCEGSASLAAAVATASPAGRRFRKDVQQLLEKVFQCKPWPNPTEKTMLARRCGLTVRQVGVWV
ncbi:uncharacterized protein T551_02163 [Pneumocystis jirovecii RU7]|uniref:Homeobox domain-containing protein n=1 Tax=Pneumocystis jirovecii (strain RU7) TaxID=1408657 RepID=A0A0W4ZMF2_PNEJ7|nr:uncharacterized protein T551_02163 [Pneumocystis jirovecii RU7]KTW29547.1 hypothetical protein T551_02163 [Pneumocystis jirovecii RU7]